MKKIFLILMVLASAALGQNIITATDPTWTGVIPNAQINFAAPAAIGSGTPGSGAFTTLTANGAATLTATTQSTTQGTGCLVLSGGLGIASGKDVFLGNRINFPAIAATTTSGDMGYDSTQTRIYFYEAGNKSFKTGTLFTGTADVTVGTTNVTATTVGAGTGSQTIAANYLVPGAYIRVVQEGIIANVAGPPTIRWRLKIGAAFVCDTGTQTMATITGTTRYHVEFLCRVTGALGATAACYCTGEFKYYSAATTANFNQALDQAATIATNGSLVVDVQETWGTSSSSNTLTSKTTTIEVLN